MMKSEPDRCRDEARQMIPWYVNGTLSDEEAAHVREHIERCDECREDAKLHSSMADAARGSDVTPMMPKTSAADILDSHGADISPIIHSRRRFPNRFAVAATLAAIAVTAIALFSINRAVDDPNQLFETATSAGNASNIDYVLQLRFENDVTEQQRSDIIVQLEAVENWSAMSNGDYEIHVKISDASLAALEQYAERAESIAGVQSAEFTALQLPMR